ncbi:RNA polymerase sigma factor [Cryobacterium sp. TMB1-7]|uniref:RNA polymerase sigma factor n=1 Tax=Cryobacterium sp. TMB1-7 TaxID=2555866 RepID=UPI00106DB211|nr:sigma factor-like helix-turn-helix DNA-binding protein [Cryobacterium sp. TMB1-7]TFC63068.1 hypothetical protein E3O60_00640 [Cryobacterium sp. TMB1-7]
MKHSSAGYHPSKTPLLLWTSSATSNWLCPGYPVAARQVITLCVLEGFKVSEAAIVLNVPDGTVESRLSRAKRRLAQEFLTGPVPATAERTS